MRFSKRTLESIADSIGRQPAVDRLFVRCDNSVVCLLFFFLDVKFSSCDTTVISCLSKRSVVCDLPRFVRFDGFRRRIHSSIKRDSNSDCAAFCLPVAVDGRLQLS